LSGRKKATKPASKVHEEGGDVLTARRARAAAPELLAKRYGLSDVTDRSHHWSSMFPAGQIELLPLNHSVAGMFWQGLA
jgi:hypothetical protein